MTLDVNRLHVVDTAPALLIGHERIVLYALIAGLQPSRILEIGTFQGGSTLIMCAALDDVGAGSITCVDPELRLAPETWAAVKHRATLVSDASPAAVAQAREIAEGPFDVAFIDGDHSMDGVIRDIEATLPTLADSAHVLFHDAHWHEVCEGINQALASHPELHDAGMISVASSTVVEGGEAQTWGGLRLLRYARTQS